MDGKSFCEQAYNYLLDIKPDTISEEKINKKYLDNTECNNPISLKDVFLRLIVSAQNYNMLPNVIQYFNRKVEIDNILFGLDYKKVVDVYTPKSLCEEFKNKLNVKAEAVPKNSWYKWSNAVISGAKFVNTFSSIDDFKKFVDNFKYNEITRVALPMVLSHEIRGFGFALSCDFIKELGYVEYCKPDVHLIDIMSGLGYCEENDYETFKCIVKTAEDGGITPYKLDKILWLISSGRFYYDDIKIKSHKEDFIKYMKQF